MSKTKGKIIITMILAFMLLCLALITSLIMPAAAHPATAGEVDSVPATFHSMGAIQAEADGGSVVTDDKGNVFYYDPLTGLVITKNGIARDDESAPLFYNPDVQEFFTSKGTSLELIRRTLDNSYWLQKGDFAISSIGITDDLYMTTVRAHTSFNPTGEEYVILCRRSLHKSNWFQKYILGKTGYYKYFNVDGFPLEEDWIYSSGNALGVGLITILVPSAVVVQIAKDYLYDMKTYYGTLDDFKIECRLYTEDIGGDFALDLYTGAKLKDDSGNYILIQNGQLVDYMRKPLIGKDAYPLFYDSENNRYHNYKGESLWTNNNVLCEANGFPAHSIMSELDAGKRLYFLPFVDLPIFIPATAAVSGTKYIYYDLNGNKIPETLITHVQPDLDDRKEHWPEEFKKDTNDIWDKIAAFLKKLGVDVNPSVFRVIFMVFLGSILLLLLSPFFKLIGMFFKFLKKRSKTKSTKTG